MHENQPLIENSEGIRCCCCDLELVAEKIHISYMGSAFSTLLLRCPRCGQPYLDQATALGKAVEVESALEEK
ncbi:MAG: hypothetical protein RR387_03675 [Clostridiales bacterium]